MPEYIKRPTALTPRLPPSDPAKHSNLRAKAPHIIPIGHSYSSIFHSIPVPLTHLLTPVPELLLRPLELVIIVPELEWVWEVMIKVPVRCGDHCKGRVDKSEYVFSEEGYELQRNVFYAMCKLHFAQSYCRYLEGNLTAQVKDRASYQ